MLASLSGIGQAAISGATEALLESATSHENGPVQQSAEHLTAINQILGTLSGLVHEVRVRIYEQLPENARELQSSIVTYYEQKLRGTQWDNVARVQEDNSRVIVCVLHRDGAIRGLFVIVAGDSDLVLANLVCDLTPDKVNQVANQATKIGLKVGLEQVIRDAMPQMSHNTR